MVSRVDKHRLRFIIETISKVRRLDETVDSDQSMEIFDNPLLLSSLMALLNRKDLLQCRLVNSSWRVVATLNLLQDFVNDELSLKYSTDFRSHFKCSQSHHRSFLSPSLSLENLHDLLTLQSSEKSNTANDILFRNFFFEGGNLSEPTIVHFFTNHGRLIHKLRLGLMSKGGRGIGGIVGSVYTPMDTVINLLSHHLPNLDTLILDSFPNEWIWASETTKENAISLITPTLPQLKSLKICSTIFYHHLKILTAIIQAAINIQKLVITDDVSSSESAFDVVFFDLLKTTNKINTVNQLLFNAADLELMDEDEDDWEPDMTSHIENFEKFIEATTPGQLTRILFSKLDALSNEQVRRTIGERTDHALTSILDKNKNSLGTLSFEQSIGDVFEHVRWPILSKVRQINFNLYLENYFLTPEAEDEVRVDERPIQFLPRDLRIAKTFPNLTTVIFCGGSIQTNSHRQWADSFPFPVSRGGGGPGGDNLLNVQTQIEPHLNVRQLFINGSSCPIEWIRKFPEIFPNVENLRVSGIRDFTLVPGDAGWRWKKLKFCYFEILLGKIYPKNCFPHIDSKLIGFDEENCRGMMMEEMTGGEGPARSRSSILELKELESLHIQFNVAHWRNEVEEGEEEDRTKLLMSTLVTEFAFNLMPSLKRVDVSNNSSHDLSVTPGSRDPKPRVNPLKMWQPLEPPFSISIGL